MEFHKIKSVKLLENMVIETVFVNGTIKKYDIKRLIEKHDIFKKLKNIEVFNKVKVDVGGYGIVWNESIDLSSEEIWKNGTIN